VTAPAGPARRYAEAAFAVAQKQHQLRAWQEDIARIEVILTDPDVAAAFANPRLDDGRRVALAISLAGDVLEREQLNFLKLVVLQGRAGVMSQIRRAFAALVDESEDRVDLEVVTARELTPPERELIDSQLRARLGRETRIQVRVDPSILGGLVIRQGDRVTDGSVRRRLAELSQAMLAG
jgi:F-type H+-transporting ATPase subunit delta